MRVDRKELTATLRVLSQIVEKRQNLPILACVRVEAVGDLVQLTATDLDVGANIWLRNETPEPMTPFCVDLAMLTKLVKAQPKSVKAITLLVELDPSQQNRPCFVVVNGAKVVCLSAEDFPPVSTTATTPVPMPGFLAALGQVAIAISHDENRFALNGVNFVPDKGVIVATDGHRLHIGRIPPVENVPAGILPRKLVAVLLTAGKSALDAGAMTKSWHESYVFTAYLKNGVIVSKLIEGQFPNYEAVLPKVEDLTVAVTIPTQTLREAVTTVSAFAEERNKPVLLSMNGGVTLSASSQEFGQSEVALVGASYTGEPTKVGLNARYLSDVLGQVASESVTIQLKDGLKPIFVKDGNFESVVMPMRI